MQKYLDTQPKIVKVNIDHVNKTGEDNKIYASVFNTSFGANGGLPFVQQSTLKNSIRHTTQVSAERQVSPTQFRINMMSLDTSILDKENDYFSKSRSN